MQPGKLKTRRLYLLNIVKEVGLVSSCMSRYDVINR